MNRIEGRDKVTGRARYAYEYPADGVAYAYPVQAAIARGRIASIDALRPLAMPGVLAVLSCAEPPALGPDAEPELALFQTRDVAYHGQIVAAIVAETLEAARAAAERGLLISYEAEPHDVRLRPDHPGLYAPDKVNPGFPTDTEKGDVTAGLAARGGPVDVTYTTPTQHNNPMEPHAAMAAWDPGGALTIYDSTQGPSADRDTIAAAARPAAGAGPGHLPARRRRIRVQGHHPAARHPGRARGPRRRPPGQGGADPPADVRRSPATGRRRSSGCGSARTAEGRLTALAHDVAEQTSDPPEFAEQTAAPSRVMYAAPALRTTHRLVRLIVPDPVLDAGARGVPRACSRSSRPWTSWPSRPALTRSSCGSGTSRTRSRTAACRSAPGTWSPACARAPAGSAGRTATRVRASASEGRWLTGTGVAASTYPARRRPSRGDRDRRMNGGFVVRIAAADIGTGAGPR